jgi:hypothetical protein
LTLAEPFFGPPFLLLPLADLAVFMAFPTASRVNVLTTVLTTTFPMPPMWLPISSLREIPVQRKGGPLWVPPLRTTLMHVLASLSLL